MLRLPAVPVFLFAFVCTLTLVFAPGVQAKAELQDGTYSIRYNILKAEDDSVSMANDYFEKPAALYVKNGKTELQLQLNHSQWITKFNVPGVQVKKVSENNKADTRVVRFPVANVSTPLITKIHVTVPSVDYDHDYTIRFAFDTESITSKGKESSVSSSVKKETVAPSAAHPHGGTPKKKTVVSSAAEKQSVATTVADEPSKVTHNSQVAVENPQTGDNTGMIAYLCLMFISLLFLVRKLVPFKGNKQHR